MYKHSNILFVFFIADDIMCAEFWELSRMRNLKCVDYGASHLIEVAKPSLSDSRSRPEQIKKRRKLIEDWSSRLEKGEDPCIVYEDIQKAATTF